MCKAVLLTVCLQEGPLVFEHLSHRYMMTIVLMAPTQTCKYSTPVQCFPHLSSMLKAEINIRGFASFCFFSFFVRFDSLSFPSPFTLFPFVDHLCPVTCFFHPLSRSVSQHGAHCMKMNVPPTET